MKISIRTLIGMLVLHLPCAASADFAGLWTNDCSETSPSLVYVIVRAHADGPYQIGYPRVRMSTPTEIVGDPNFAVVGEDEVVYMGTRLYRCERFSVPEYDALDHTLIADYLIGDWAVMYRAINGRRTLISNGRIGLPDLSFFDDGRLRFDLKGKRNESSYEISEANLVLNVEKGQVFRILMIDNEELHLATEQEPSSGVLIFHRRTN